MNTDSPVTGIIVAVIAMAALIPLELAARNASVRPVTALTAAPPCAPAPTARLP